MKYPIQPIVTITMSALYINMNVPSWLESAVVTSRSFVFNSLQNLFAPSRSAFFARALVKFYVLLAQEAKCSLGELIALGQNSDS